VAGRGHPWRFTIGGWPGSPGRLPRGARLGECNKIGTGRMATAAVSGRMITLSLVLQHWRHGIL
jgi:hypothetical protein